MLRKPTIPFNSLTTMHPDLIGLAAHLCIAPYSDYMREKILKHAAEHGNLDGLKGKDLTFDSDLDWRLASQALEEGKHLVIDDKAPAHTPDNGAPPLEGGLGGEDSERTYCRSANGGRTPSVPIAGPRKSWDNGCLNGHRFDLPPIAGGAPALDPAGVNGQSDPHDIEF